MRENQQINVLFMSSEADPLIKIGGLGDVAGSLPKALQKVLPAQLHDKKMDIRMVIPFHSVITRRFDNFQLAASFKVPYIYGDIPARAFLTYVDDLPVYLLEGMSILSDPGVYSPDPLIDTRKYIFFSRAALELAKAINWHVDVVHANDWHTALSVYDLKIRRQQDPFYSNTHSVLSMHNVPYMGVDSGQIIHEFGLSSCECPNLPEWARTIPLPIGMFAADQLLTVSPTYAKEILTPEFGCGLQDFLATRKDSISGILNGIDEKMWDPTTDPALTKNFGPTSLAARTKNKLKLQSEFNLKIDKNIPLVILISRMDPQKGIDIAVEGLRKLSDLVFQVILLGTGDPIIEAACRSLEVEFPENVRAAIRFDLNLSRRMYAGGDLILIPSRYEPCGLTQMIGMRYGCVPLARATGGLKDTIVDIPGYEGNNGFLFESATAQEFAQALRRALRIFENQTNWADMQRIGMSTDFSWEKSALQYAQIYEKLSGGER